MSGLTVLRIACTLALLVVGSSSASAWGWWDRYCDGPYCYGPPYGNIEPPAVYVYDHQTGPTWTGNGWAYLPVGTYRPVPPGYVPVPPPYVERGGYAYPPGGYRPMK